MKVRARVKAPEYLPDSATCCEASKDYLREVGVISADISMTKNFPGGACRFCGKVPQSGGTDVMAETESGRKGWFRIDYLDLDEGPMESGAALSGERA